MILQISGLNSKQYSNTDPINALQSVSSQSPLSISSSPKSDLPFGMTSTYRIIWCLYVPEPGQDESAADDASRIFVLCRKSRAHIINLDLVLSLYEAQKGPLSVDELKSGGHLVIDEHKSTILTASFSPDGSAIATACNDGEIGFFKISFSDASAGIKSSIKGLMDKNVRCFR